MRIHAIFGGIGAFAVKFRWVVIAVWLIAAFAVPKFLPSLASVTQGNNSAFLPASAPSEQASQLAAPFGATQPGPGAGGRGGQPGHAHRRGPGMAGQAAA